MEYLLVPNFLENVQEKLKYEAFLLRISNLSCIGSLLERPSLESSASLGPESAGHFLFVAEQSSL